MSLYYSGIPASGFGWGTCNTYLIRELEKLCRCLHGDLKHTRFNDAAVFMPLVNHDLEAASDVRGNINLGYCFFESELGPKAAENAARYDVVFCGSTWCLERMKERGITNGRVLIQGVDFDIFRPCVDGANMRRGDEFRIFSGGKLEYRKGQDIVIAAVRELVKSHPNVKLVTAWHNPWPGLIWSMEQSPHIRMPGMIDQWDQVRTFKQILESNGIPPANFEVHGQLSQPELAAAMNSTDLGVFPNRCEGGTNLVLMEYMACGKPAVAADGTGHADILAATYPNCLRPRNDAPGWCECPVDAVVEQIKWFIIDDPERRTEGGEHCRQAMQQFTWERAARQIVETVKELQ